MMASSCEEISDQMCSRLVFQGSRGADFAPDDAQLAGNSVADPVGTPAFLCDDLHIGSASWMLSQVTDLPAITTRTRGSRSTSRRLSWSRHACWRPRRCAGLVPLCPFSLDRLCLLTSLHHVHIFPSFAHARAVFRLCTFVYASGELLTTPSQPTPPQASSPLSYCGGTLGSGTIYWR